jgi:hypothetical protein
MLRSRQPTIRVNQGYRIDSKWEALALVWRGLRGLARRVWPYRTEVGLLLAVVYLRVGLSRLLPADLDARWQWAATGGVGAGLLCWPRARWLVLNRLACARSRRRILACCRQTRVANAAGQLPRVLRSRSTPVGERLLLSVRAGQSAELLDARIEELRAAAKARDVQITRDPGRADMVTVEVIRRDPLTGAAPLPSPLLDVARALHARHATTLTVPTVPAAAGSAEEAS